MGKALIFKLLTAQEHETIGSTVDRSYMEKPHIPLAIVDKTISVEACNRLRIGGGPIRALPFYWGLDFSDGAQRLEALELDPSSENYGRTLRDNVLIEVKGPGEGNVDYSDGFPFKREPKPRVELDDP